MTAVVLAALLLPSMAMMASPSRASCCCKSSGTCPLRKQAGCEKSCSMDSSNSTFRAPQLSREPAVFATSSTALATFSTDLDLSAPPSPLTRATPPSLPPPRA